MVDQLLPPSFFAEAENRDTPAKRLAELARHVILQPLIAANEAAPSAILTQLSDAEEQDTRRAIALNPNTSLPVLSRLAGEFPQEFLHNPIIPFLTITQPDFVKKLPFTSWASLLRFADLSPTWLKQLKDDKAYRNLEPACWKLLQLHVSLADTTIKESRVTVGKVRLAYQQKLPQPTKELSPEEDRELFLLFVLLFPFTAPMLKEQWISGMRLAPRAVGHALSQCKEVGNTTLNMLLHEKNPFVLSQIACHPATAPKVLARLATYKRPEVRRAVAGNIHTPAGAMSRLLFDDVASIRRRAVVHPVLEPSERDVMVLDDDDTVRAALATLPILHSQISARLMIDSAQVVRAALARNLQVSPEILSALARDAEPVVRAAAAGNPRLPVEIQTELLADTEETVRASLSGNARLPAEYAARLAQDASPLVRKHLAANPRTPSALLEALWQTGSVEVRQGLARHPKASPELLARLAQQGDKYTRAAVAAHKKTPPELLARLARENVSEIWEGLVANPHTPLDLLEEALETSFPNLAYRLIHHPAIVRDRRRLFLKLLASKIQLLIATDCLPNWLRRVFLQYYTALPLEIVTLFASSPYWEERYLTTHRLSLPAAVRQRLAQDGIYYVQDAARTLLEQ